MKILNILDLLPAKTAESLAPSTIAFWSTLYSYIRLCHFADIRDQHFVSFLQHKYPGVTVATISRHLQRMANAKLIEPSTPRDFPLVKSSRYTLPKKSPKGTP